MLLQGTNLPVTSLKVLDPEANSSPISYAQPSIEFKYRRDQVYSAPFGLYNSEVNRALHASYPSYRFPDTFGAQGHTAPR